MRLGPQSVTLRDDTAVTMRAVIERSREAVATCAGSPERQIWADYNTIGAIGSAVPERVI